MASAVLQFPLIKYAASKVRDWLIDILKAGPVPKHIALIMDGNRRYARIRKWETSEGHSKGFDTLSSTLEMCYKAGVEAVTVFAFSIENFKRSKREVDSLMDIAKSKLTQIIEHGDLAEQYGIKIKILGNLALLPKDIRAVADRAVAITAKNDKVILNICFPYTSSDDITQSIQKIIHRVETGDIHDINNEINQHLLDTYMYPAESPDIDILIRTSGITRLSNFMIWQCNDGCTMEFISALWPELSFWHMYDILLRWSAKQSSLIKSQTEGDRSNGERPRERQHIGAGGPYKLGHSDNSGSVSPANSMGSSPGLYSDSSTLDEEEYEEDEDVKLK